VGIFEKLICKEAPTEKPLRRQARVFIEREGSRSIVVTVHHNQDSVLCEGLTPAVLDNASDAALGEATHNALKATARIVHDLRSVKASDWPAYKASGKRSIRSFEKDFVAIRISGANEHNVVYELECLLDHDPELSVTSRMSNNATADEVGQRLRKMFLAARDRKL
jgi:hypothetical protein